MNDPGTQDELIGRRIGTLRIIVVALMNGLVLFLGVVLFAGLGPQAPAAPLPGLGLPVLTAVAVAFFLIDLVLAVILPGIATNAARKQIARGTLAMPGANDAEKLLAVYGTRTVLGGALLEGAGFFGAVAALIEGHWAGLVVAGAAAVLIGALFFPTHGRVAAWLAAQLDALEQDRRAGDFPSGR